MLVHILPMKLWGEDNMLDGLLDGLQEASGRILTSSIVGKMAGAFFVVACLVSGVCVLVTAMYLADPEGFDKRLSQVLVERPVIAASVGEVEEVEEAEEGEEVGEGEEIEEEEYVEEEGEDEEE
ncbi:MAG: hypothetical protein ACUZ8A_09950 [Candidatus Bathyanammoxibius sp.]